MYQAGIIKFTFLYFSKVVPGNLTYHEDLRNFKEIQVFCEDLGCSLNFLNLFGLIDYLVKVSWNWPLEYYRLSINSRLKVFYINF